MNSCEMCKAPCRKRFCPVCRKEHKRKYEESRIRPGHGSNNPTKSEQRTLACVIPSRPTLALCNLWLNLAGRL